MIFVVSRIYSNNMIYLVSYWIHIPSEHIFKARVASINRTFDYIYVTMVGKTQYFMTNMTVSDLTVLLNDLQERNKVCTNKCEKT